MRRPARFLARWQNRMGLILVGLFVAVALGAPVLSPMDPKEPGPFKRVGRVTDHVPHPPDETAPLGTLPGQVDVYHALVWGTREAVWFGLVVAVGAFITGIVIGAAAGYAGGALNSLLMRLTDAFLTFPVIAAVVFLQQMVATTIQSMGGIYWFNNEYLGRVVYFEFTPPGWVSFLMHVDPLMICLILFLWMPYARLVNALVLTLKRTEFIQAARSLGAGPGWVIRRHLIPNSLGPAVVLGARDVGHAVILQATFTFIGLGGTSSWGTLLSMGRNWIIGPGGDLLAAWWVYMPATLAVVLFGVTWNVLGDGMNEVFDPRSR
jgi:peptide/nickel transport system permease protein